MDRDSPSNRGSVRRLVSNRSHCRWLGMGITWRGGSVEEQSQRNKSTHPCAVSPS